MDAAPKAKDLAAKVAAASAAAAGDVVAAPTAGAASGASAAESLLGLLQRQVAQQQTLLSQQQLELLQLSEAARAQQRELEQRSGELQLKASQLAARERELAAEAEALAAREARCSEMESRLEALQEQCLTQYLTLKAVHAEMQERLLAAGGECGGVPYGGDRGAGHRRLAPDAADVSVTTVTMHPTNAERASAENGGPGPVGQGATRRADRQAAGSWEGGAEAGAGAAAHKSASRGGREDKDSRGKKGSREDREGKSGRQAGAASHGRATVEGQGQGQGDGGPQESRETAGRSKGGKKRERDAQQDPNLRSREGRRERDRDRERGRDRDRDRGSGKERGSERNAEAAATGPGDLQGSGQQEAADGGRAGQGPQPPRDDRREDRREDRRAWAGGERPPRPGGLPNGGQHPQVHQHRYPQQQQQNAQHQQHQRYSQQRYSEAPHGGRGRGEAWQDQEQAHGAGRGLKRRWQEESGGGGGGEEAQTSAGQGGRSRMQSELQRRPYVWRREAQGEAPAGRPHQVEDGDAGPARNSGRFNDEGYDTDGEGRENAYLPSPPRPAQPDADAQLEPHPGLQPNPHPQPCASQQQDGQPQPSAQQEPADKPQLREGLPQKAAASVAAAAAEARLQVTGGGTATKEADGGADAGLDDDIDAADSEEDVSVDDDGEGEAAPQLVPLVPRRQDDVASEERLSYLRRLPYKRALKECSRAERLALKAERREMHERQRLANLQRREQRAALAGEATAAAPERKNRKEKKREKVQQFKLQQQQAQEQRLQQQQQRGQERGQRQASEGKGKREVEEKKGREGEGAEQVESGDQQELEREWLEMVRGGLDGGASLGTSSAGAGVAQEPRGGEREADRTQGAHASRPSGGQQKGKHKGSGLFEGSRRPHEEEGAAPSPKRPKHGPTAGARGGTDSVATPPVDSAPGPTGGRSGQGKDPSGSKGMPSPAARDQQASTQPTRRSAQVAAANEAADGAASPGRRTKHKDQQPAAAAAPPAAPTGKVSPQAPKPAPDAAAKTAAFALTGSDRQPSAASPLEVHLVADHVRSVLDQLAASGVLPVVGAGGQSPAAQPTLAQPEHQQRPQEARQAPQDAGASCDVPPPPPAEQPPPQVGTAGTGGLSSVSGTSAHQGGVEGAKSAQADAALSGSHRGGGAHPRPVVRPRLQHPQPHVHNAQQPELKQAYEVQLEAYFHLHGNHQPPNGNAVHRPPAASGNSYSRPWGGHPHGSGGSSLVWTRPGGAGHGVQGVGQGHGEAQEQGQGHSRGQGRHGQGQGHKHGQETQEQGQRHSRGQGRHGQGQGQKHGQGHGRGQGQEHGRWVVHQGQAEPAVVLDPPPPWRQSHAVSGVDGSTDMQRGSSGQHGGGVALLADRVAPVQLQHHQQLQQHHSQHQPHPQLHHQQKLLVLKSGLLGASGGGLGMLHGTGGAGGVHAPAGAPVTDAGTRPGVHAPGVQHAVSLHTHAQPQVQAHIAAESSVQQAGAGAGGAPADVAGSNVPPGFARPLPPPYARGGLYRRRPGKAGDGDSAAGRHPQPYPHPAGAHGVGSEVRLGAPRGVRDRGSAVGAAEEGDGDGPDEDLAGAVDLLRQEQEHDPQSH